MVKRRAVHVSGYEREGRDFYATPAWVTEALLKHITFRAPIWEPCCGDGAMSKVFLAHGHQVTSTDIVQRGYGRAGVDFLACRSVPPGCGAIVTNPPYGDTGTQRGQAKSSVAMLSFLRHALRLTASVNGQLALLVRLQWIAGQRAADIMSAAHTLVRHGRADQPRPTPPRLGRVRPHPPYRRSACVALRLALMSVFGAGHPPRRRT